MVSRAKLTLVTKQEELPSANEGAAPEAVAVVAEDMASESVEQAFDTPTAKSRLVKGLVLVGLTVVSVVIFKRKIF